MIGGSVGVCSCESFPNRAVKQIADYRRPTRRLFPENSM